MEAARVAAGVLATVVTQTSRLSLWKSGQEPSWRLTLAAPPACSGCVPAAWCRPAGAAQQTRRLCTSCGRGPCWRTWWARWHGWQSWSREARPRRKSPQVTPFLAAPTCGGACRPAPASSWRRRWSISSRCRCRPRRRPCSRRRRPRRRRPLLHHHLPALCCRPTLRRCRPRRRPCRPLRRRPRSRPRRRRRSTRRHGRRRLHRARPPRPPSTSQPWLRPPTPTARRSFTTRHPPRLRPRRPRPSPRRRSRPPPPRPLRLLPRPRRRRPRHRWFATWLGTSSTPSPTTPAPLRTRPSPGASSWRTQATPTARPTHASGAGPGTDRRSAARMTRWAV